MSTRSSCRLSVLSGAAACSQLVGSLGTLAAVDTMKAHDAEPGTDSGGKVYRNCGMNGTGSYMLLLLQLSEGDREDVVYCIQAQDIGYALS